MTFGDIVDELHDKHCLTHTGTAEKTDFTTLAVRLEKVNHLDTGKEDFSTDSEVLEFRSRLMDGTEFIAVEFGETVDGIANNVEQTAFHLVTGRNGDRAFKVVDTSTALQTVCTLHSHTAHGVLTDMLLHFEYQLRTVGTVHLQGGVDRRDEIVITFKYHVDHRADHLGDFAKFFTHRVYCFLGSEIKPVLKFINNQI